MKPIAKSRAAVSARELSDETLYQPELLAEDEPRYLRRQKPVEIRRRKFARRSWEFYRRVVWISMLVLAAGTALFFTGRFFLFSPQVLLSSPDQILISGAHMVSREAIISRFYADHGRSVLRVPLEERRAALEELPWIEQAIVQRILPDRIRVAVTERTPVALLRSGSELSLIDAHGVILERPPDQDFSFPVLSGAGENHSLAERERRMQNYMEFLKAIELVKAGSSQLLSEADLSNPKDLRVVMTGLAGGAAASRAVTLHFGRGDYLSKFRMLIENFAQWQAGAGRIHSIDLQYTRQVVVNPEPGVSPASPAREKKPR